MDENALKDFVARYLKLLFGFCLSYGAYSREQAFQITVSSFARVLGQRLSPYASVSPESLFKQILAECTRVTPAGSAGLEAFGALPSTQQPFLGIVRQALMRLSAADRALLLLRDQCHLPFDRIAAILGADVRETRSTCMSARERLRSSVQGVLEGGGTGHAV